MAVVADQPVKTRRARRLHLGANAILTRPWILVVVVTSSLVAWLFQPDRSVSGLSRSFALPPLDVYSDAAVRSRGWGAFIFLVLLRYVTLAIIISFVLGRGPSGKQLLMSLGFYAGAALSYAIPLNLGRTFLIYSADEGSSLPGMAVIATPFVLVILTSLFTRLLLRSSTTSSSRVGWLIPALSVGLWTVGPRLLQANEISSLGVLLALVFVSVQALLLVSLTESFRARDDTASTAAFETVGTR